MDGVAAAARQQRIQEKRDTGARKTLGSDASRTRRPFGRVSARYAYLSLGDFSTRPSGNTMSLPGALLYSPMIGDIPGTDSAADRTVADVSGCTAA